MSNDAKPEFQALAELEDVLRQLTGELAAWRRRAQRAENALGADRDTVGTRERLLALESENVQLGQRLSAARERVTELVKRLQFLEEQVALEDPSR